MAHMQRIETLSRHLTTATGLDVVSVADELADNTVPVGTFNPRELYEYTVRDNIELRDRILEFLKVKLSAKHSLLPLPVLQSTSRQSAQAAAATCVFNQPVSSLMGQRICRMISSSQIITSPFWSSASKLWRGCRNLLLSASLSPKTTLTVCIASCHAASISGIIVSIHQLAN